MIKVKTGWPKAAAKLDAAVALSDLPPSQRPFYKDVYKITFDDRDGDFAGLECRVCSWIDEHEPGCPVDQIKSITWKQA